MEKNIKIFKLVHNGNVIYIGSTSCRWLSTRKAQPISKMDNEIRKQSSIELIEEVTEEQREKRLKYWIEIEKPEYNKTEEQKKESTRKARNKYYQKNKDKFAKRGKEWREKNIEYLREKWREKEQTPERKAYQREYQKKK